LVQTSSGTGAYFRVDSIALDRKDCKRGGWADYGNLFANQGDCVTVGA
jgi:hypothetical protein